MKKLIIAILLLIGVSGCSHITPHTTITHFESKPNWYPMCNYYYMTNVVNSYFIDTCNKFKVGDTIWITNKKP